MIRQPQTVILVVAAGLCVLSACEPGIQVGPDSSSRGTNTLATSLTSNNVQTAVLSAYQALPATPSATEYPLPPNGIPATDMAATRYDVKATLDWLSRSLEVEQRIAFLNDTGQAQNTVVFNVSANLPPDIFGIDSILDGDGYPVEDFILEETRLTIPLKDELADGCPVHLVIHSHLALPEIRNGYWFGRLGYLGYSERQINLGMWLPLLAAYDPDQGWLTPASHMVGEQEVLRAADFALEFSLAGAPEDVRVAGPGYVTRPDDSTWIFTLDDARDITLSIATDFRTMTTVTASGVKVDLFYFPDPSNGALDAPRHALNVAADALVLYESLYGDYPYDRMVVVEGDFPDGMEFSGLVFVSSTWFGTWKGVPNDWLTIITAHEVSHQWWYTLVGSDQGQHPYMDEALAVFSEALFFEHVYPEYVDWWWDFRIAKYAPSGYVDSAVYEFDSVREYINTIYLQGALMMQALRQDLGSDAFLEWLHAYAQQMKGSIAHPVDLWGVLSESQYAATEGTRTRFLQNADVLLQARDLP